MSEEAINEAINTCVNICNMTDDPHIEEMAKHVADILMDILPKKEEKIELNPTDMEAGWGGRQWEPMKGRGIG